jgi:hypothetical protein
VTFASDSFAVAGVYRIGIGVTPHDSEDGWVRSDKATRQLDLDCESADISRSAQPHLHASRVSHFRMDDSTTASAPAQIHGRKVSLQILQSVLLL